MTIGRQIARTAGRARPERDLRADAARVAGGDRDALGHFQGSREAWITSGTPVPPLT